MSIWANTQIWDGVVSRSVWSRIDTWIVVANNYATDLTGRVLPPLTFGNSIAPWRVSLGPVGGALGAPGSAGRACAVVGMRARAPL
jgi:hypothetical protein